MASLNPNEKKLDEAVRDFDPRLCAAEVARAESQRAEILERFPIDHWKRMTLEEYALGQDDSEDTYCRWLEFRTIDLGSIRGGSARKLVIFKRKSEPGWYFPKMFSDEVAAWEHLRSDFLQAIEYAKAGDWAEIDSLEVLSQGPVLRLKTLHLYFPNDVLPVYSKDHMRHFLRRLGRPEEEASGYAVVQTNRNLLAALREIPALEGCTTKELERFLYWWADPRDAKRVVKIAPGERGKYWEDCLAGGYICVGWDDVGDLEQYESKEAFRERFGSFYPYNGHRPAVVRKSNELWSLTDLEPGDLVVANQGTSRILAVGRVIEPGYQWEEGRAEARHTVTVYWDRGYSKDIPAQKAWATVTVKKVPEQLFAEITATRSEPAAKPKPELAVPVDPFYQRVASAVERKGQLILYGPPGTGKTYTARRFAVWWLLRRLGDPRAETVLGNAAAMSRAEQELSTGQVARRVWWVVANAKQWSWNELEREKAVTYRYGRLKKNYPLVQQGDWVVGYQASPDKQVVALARVSRPLHTGPDGEPAIELEWVAPIRYGCRYDELLADPVLAASEPLRSRCQGTLFGLTSAEAEHLFSLLAEGNPELAALDSEDSEVGCLTRITFHPSYTYEDFIEGYRPRERPGGGLALSLEDGIFKRVCRAAQAHPERPYLVLIDEINRGNVAKIFGELLTLLERDKRGLTLTLPQSKESFLVPPNVYLLGTMNTADRSIKLLDAALRRRFSFIELMPDIELLRGATVGGLALDEFLEELNRRIARSEGREKQIGHAYLLEGGAPVSDSEAFARSFREEILPLLQEVCYDEYGTLARFLGTGLVDAEAQTLDHEKVADAEQLVATLAQELGGGAEPEE